jgi:hypothetical protein
MIEDEEVEPIFYDPPPDITIDNTPEEVAAIASDDRFYTKGLAREPGDAVVSGPVSGGWGPGRYFQSRRLAHAHCVEKYGEARVKQLQNWTRGRWAFLIKDLRKGI